MKQLLHLTASFLLYFVKRGGIGCASVDGKFYCRLARKLTTSGAATLSENHSALTAAPSLRNGSIHIVCGYSKAAVVGQQRRLNPKSTFRSNLIDIKQGGD